MHAEGYPAGEMKHGPIALLEDGFPVIALAPRDGSYDRMMSNLEEVRAREGRVFAIGHEGDRELAAKSVVDALGAAVGRPDHADPAVDPDAAPGLSHGGPPRPRRRPAPQPRQVGHRRVARSTRRTSVRGRAGHRSFLSYPLGSPSASPRPATTLRGCAIVCSHVAPCGDRRQSPRAPEPAAARGGHDHEGPRARPGRGGERQDPGHRPPHRLSPGGGGHRPAARARGHLHQQGRRRDAAPGGGPAAARGHPPAAHRHLPLGVRAHPASARGPGRAPALVRDLRRGRPPEPGEGGAARARLRRADADAEHGGAPHQPLQEPDAVARGRGAGRPHPARGASRLALPALRGEAPGRGRPRLRRPAAAGGAAARDGARGAALVSHGVVARAGGRVPGHQPRAVPHRAAPHRGAPEPLRGGRSRPVGLSLAGRGSAQHPRLREGLPGLPGGGARAELPLHQAHPRHRLRGDRQQHRAQGQAALDRERRGRAGGGLPGLGRERGVRVRGAEDPRPARGGAGLPGRRGVLPHQRPVPRPGRRAAPRGHPVPDRGRRALLRAARDPGHGGLPPPDLEPARRRGLPPGGGRARPRHRQGHARSPGRRGPRGGRRRS